MGKKIEMFKCFYKVMKSDKRETQKVIPDMYAESFYTIDEDYLIKNGINKLILDIDGTLLPTDDKIVSSKLKKRFELLKDKGIEMCLVSNNNIDRVFPVAKDLSMQNNFLANANKPLKEAFDKSLEILHTNKKNEVAMVGDQMMSDIKGANEYGIFSILVKPVSKRNNIQTGTSRLLQNIMEKHLKRQDIFDKNKYYKRRVKK